MATATHATMHHDHRQWVSDNDMWRCDIANWQQELKKAEIDFKQVEEAFKAHERALQTHAAAICLRQQELATHEHALAEYQRGNLGAGLVPLGQSHDQEAGKHAQQSEAHERIKRHHHDLMCKMGHLRESANKPL